MYENKSPIKTTILIFSNSYNCIRLENIVFFLICTICILRILFHYPLAELNWNDKHK